MRTAYTETADIETASDDYALRFSGDVGRFFLDVQARLTLAYLQDLPGAAVLDVGGGHAQLARPLIDSGFRLTVTGSDDCCRRRLDAACAPGSFTYQTCDSLHLPFADNQFDVVMAFRLLPHTESWQKLLGEMCRVAGKCVIFDYPDRRSANIFYDMLFQMKKSMEGNTRTFTLFSRNEIRTVLEGYGYSKPQFTPEFFMPMVVHRKLNSGGFSRSFEKLFGITGLTRVFGSPVIVRSDAPKSQDRGT